jgi:hypothetical protein
MVAVVVAAVEAQAQGRVREQGAGIVLEAERLPGEVGWVRREMVQSQRPYHVASLLYHRALRRHRGLLRPQSQRPSEQRSLPQ